MRKAGKALFISAVSAAAAGIFLTACAVSDMGKEVCGFKAALAKIETEAVSAEEMMTALAEAELMRKSILIDFPFPRRMYDEDDTLNYTLMLVCVDETESLYELRLYDKDKNITQQILCGKLEEPVRFSYDDLTRDSYADLEIFPCDSQTGMLFINDYRSEDTGRLFQEKTVEIPVYDECTWNGFVVYDEDAVSRVETVYQINEEKDRAEALRSLEWQKEDSTLQIWDYLDNRSILKEKAALREDGSLENEEYYQFLFRNNIYNLTQVDEDWPITVWVSQTDKETRAEENGEQSGFEWAQEVVFGNTGYSTEYENRQTFLAAFGFADEEPFYQYYDNRGNLQLELYLDEEDKRGCGLIYRYCYTYQMEKEESAYGFAFDAVYQGEWKAADPYRLTSVDGYTGENAGREYEEIIEYTEDGKIDYYKSMAFVDWIGGEEEKKEKDELLEINYIYRDDGTLYYRDYSHNGMIFSSTYCSLDSYYDEFERVVYESGYITHGSMEEYYIYDDNGKEPAYYLSLDDNLGYCIPTLVRFH